MTTYLESNDHGGFDDDYLFGIVGGLVVTTYLELPRIVQTS